MAIRFQGEPWFVTYKDSVFIDDASGKVMFQGAKRSWAQIETKNGTRAIVAFTTEETLEQYLKERADPEMVPIRPDSPDGFLHLLENQKLNGIEHIAFDPVREFTLTPIDAMITAIKKATAGPQ